MSLMADLLPNLTRVEEFLTSCENILRGHDPMSCDLDRHQAISDQLQELQRTLPPFQPVVDQLNSDLKHVRETMEGAARMEADQLKQKVQSVNNRWEEVCSQSHQR